MTSNSDVSTRRRVKLYMLNEERQWDDKGTGHVSATFVEVNSMALVVISETDGSHLLESKIQHDTAYQKQQETLIVWSEGDNMDLALSFQEKTGCDDIWEKICNVQGKDPSVDITQDLIDDADDADDMEMDTNTTGNNQGFEFPTCDLNHLLEISEMFTQVVNYPIQRERLATALERSQYLKQLVDLFHKAEDLEDEKSLHYLYEIMRAIVQFNRRNLYELIFSDEMMMDTVGILEYNPHKRVRHRDFLTKKAAFREVLPMSGALKTKIQQTYRVQYVQDACMPPPSLFDENGSSSLNSFVYLNKIDIVTKLQDDPAFSQHLFSGLLSADTTAGARRDLLLLLKEFCTIVNSLQPSQKESFFNFLCANRALKSIFHSFRVADESLKPVCLEIIQIFIENQASVVREFFIQDSRENAAALATSSSSSNNNSGAGGGASSSSSTAATEALCINALIDQLVNDCDSELSNAFVIANMLKVLLDPENMINSNQKNEKQEFLNFFYKCSVGHLTKPLVELTTGCLATGDDAGVVNGDLGGDQSGSSPSPLKYDDYHTAMVMHQVLELLAFCVEFHSYNMKNYAFHHNLLLRVVALFRSRHQFVVLAALRVVRKFVASKEEFNYRYMVKNGVLGHVVALLDRNRRYNMLNSACLELFEFVRTENIACLINHVVEHHWDQSLRHHGYVNTFQSLKARYDQTVERSLKAAAATTTGVGPGPGPGVSAAAAGGGGTGSITPGGGTTGATSSINMLSLMNAASSRLRKDTRALDEEEEQWYDQDDEEDDDVLGGYQQQQQSSPAFVERYTRTGGGAGGKDDSPFKLASSGRYGRDQHHILINIKSTNLSLGGSVSSTTQSPSPSQPQSSKQSSGLLVTATTGGATIGNVPSSTSAGGHALAVPDNGAGAVLQTQCSSEDELHQHQQQQQHCYKLLTNGERDERNNKDLHGNSSNNTSGGGGESVASSNSEAAMHKPMGEAPSCVLTGLVDYSSDDEDDTADITSISSRSSGGGTSTDSAMGNSNSGAVASGNVASSSSSAPSKDCGEWGDAVSSPKRLKID